MNKFQQVNTVIYEKFSITLLTYSTLNINAFVGNWCETQKEKRGDRMKNRGKELTSIKNLLYASHYVWHFA